MEVYIKAGIIILVMIVIIFLFYLGRDKRNGKIIIKEFIDKEFYNINSQYTIFCEEDFLSEENVFKLMSVILLGIFTALISGVYFLPRDNTRKFIVCYNEEGMSFKQINCDMFKSRITNMKKDFYLHKNDIDYIEIKSTKDIHKYIIHTRHLKNPLNIIVKKETPLQTQQLNEQMIFSDYVNYINNTGRNNIRNINNYNYN